jgi:hypothetical protein
MVEPLIITLEVKRGDNTLLFLPATGLTPYVCWEAPPGGGFISSDRKYVLTGLHLVIDSRWLKDGK